MRNERNIYIYKPEILSKSETVSNVRNDGFTDYLRWMRLTRPRGRKPGREGGGGGGVNLYRKHRGGGGVGGGTSVNMEDRMRETRGRMCSRRISRKVPPTRYKF